MEKVNWGIIGCGDVTEIKSGPAFNEVKDSSLVAVMRRNREKAKDYAERHHVSKWYSDATELINDQEVNAIYIATPPSSHEEYTLAAIKARKPVYVEKPMTVNAASARKMVQTAKENNIKLCVAHYRRTQPFYNKIKQLINDKVIGNIKFVRLELNRIPITKEYLTMPNMGWRVDEAVAGGGLFHDLSPHQLDLMYYYFGEVEKASGYSANQLGLYAADDIVTGNIQFKNGVMFNGVWCFSAPDDKDYCEIVGSEGKIGFSFFENKPITIWKNGKTDTFNFDPLPHVQQPLIEKVVQYFLGNAPNPCSGDDGAYIMQLIDQFTTK